MRRKSKERIASLLAGLFLVSLTMASLTMGTYAWYTAEPAEIEVDSDDTATITCAAPESALFYYFKGNGTPGSSSSYTGYSKSDATFGNKTNMVNTSTNKFTVDEGEHYIDLAAVPSENNDCWGKIDVANSTAVNNAFDFSRIRPGCYYTFAVIYASTHADLQLTFAEGTTGNDKTPKRRVYDGTAKTNPLSLVMAMNGSAAVLTTEVENVRSYFSTAFTNGATKANDKINFNYASPSYVYDFVSNTATNGSNACIYFTVYMGAGNKADAVLYNSKAGTGAGEMLYYQLNQTSGDYSPFNGLTLTLNRIEVKEHS